MAFLRDADPPKLGADFAVDAAAAIRAQRGRGGRLVIWLMLLFVVAAVAWAYFAVLEEVVRGTGKVIPSSQVQVVQNLEGGIVESIAVREGDTVERGQVLLQIDDTRFDSSLQESRVRQLGLEAKSIRLETEAEGARELPDFAAELIEVLPGVVNEQRALFRQRLDELEANQLILAQQLEQKRQAIAELDAKHEYLARSLGLARKELRMTRPLAAQGAVSEVEILRLERQVNELHGELSQTELRRPRIQAELGEVERRMEELEVSFRKDARAELNEVLAELNALVAGNVALRDRVERTQVRAPIKGVIKKLTVTTVGGVVQPGMDLVELVPLEDSLVVEARVRPRDIAFLRPNLPAVVKLTAYDFALFGGLDAQLEHISADTFVDEDGVPYYLVRVRTDRPGLEADGTTYPIIPGMTAEIDILVGEKTILDYLLKPVLRAKSLALREP